MAKDEGKDQGGTKSEDLFEDLDKFFAPIQDVDWPESKPEPPTREAEPRKEDDLAAQPEEPEEDRGSTQAFETEEGEVTEVPEDEVELEGEEAEPEVKAEELFTSAEEDEDVEAVDEVLFAAEAEREPDQETSGYVDLPGDAEPRVVSIDDEGAPVPEAPDIEAVEAAADHFAESVREEVRVEPAEPAEPEEGVPAPTEEVAIEALLGEEGPEDLEEPESRTVGVGVEGFGGPSWQEPTAIEVGAEPETRGPGRNVPTAFITGLALAALAFGALLIGPGPFGVFAGIVVLFAQGEFYLALQKRHYQPATALGLVAGALVLGAAYYRGESAMLAIVALSLFATFLWYMTVPQPYRRNVVSNAALTVLGIVYIPALAAYALTVLQGPDGEELAISIIGLTIVYDTAAFAVGYFWGSRPLAPNVSPKKSWEGAVGATLVTIAVAVGVVAPSVTLLDTVGRSVGLAVVVAIFAPLGDLAESLIKRDLGIKDMGGILPGHGGVMDRIDSVLFVAPAALLYLRLVL